MHVSSKRTTKLSNVLRPGAIFTEQLLTVLETFIELTNLENGARAVDSL